MEHQHLYLFALEIEPLTVGEMYNPLPSHLTLMHRFWAGLAPDSLAAATEPLFDTVEPLQIVFDETKRLGKSIVHVVEQTSDLEHTHLNLYELLNTLGVSYTAPQWVGHNYMPHVTERPGVAFTAGHTKITRFAYLVEVIKRDDADERIIRAKFALAG